MAFKVFKLLFPNSTLAGLHATRKQSCCKHKISWITNIFFCTVRSRYEDKSAKCRFFAVPGDDKHCLE